MEQFIKKLKNLITNQPDLIWFGFFIFLLPFNIGKFLGIALPYSDQVFNHWTAVFLYVSDAILLVAILLWLIRIFRGRFRVKMGSRWLMFGLLLFTVAILISLFANPGWPASLLGFGRWVEILLIITYISLMVVTWRRRFAVILIWFIAISIQAFIAVFQFLLQQSLGLKLLGESVLSVHLQNVAKIVVDGQIWLRAYGTQVHPNVLGYFLVISLIFAGFLYARVRSVPWRIIISSLAGVQIMALVMCFSRTAWLGLVLGLGVLVVLCLIWRVGRASAVGLDIRRILPLLITMAVLVATVIAYKPMIQSRLVTGDSNGDLSLSFRQELNQLGWNRFSTQPLTGQGLRQFVPSLKDEPSICAEPWKFQPIHNAFLLILVETGIFGLLAWLLIIAAKFIILFGKLKNVPRGTFFYRNTDVLYVFTIISAFAASVFLMTYDHYIFDVYQSAVLYGLILAL